MRQYSENEIQRMADNNLTPDQFNYIDIVLQNMESASNNTVNVALLNYGIAKDIRLAALKLRPQFLIDPLCELHINENGLTTSSIRERLRNITSV